MKNKIVKASKEDEKSKSSVAISGTGGYHMPKGYFVANGLINSESRDGYSVVCELFVIDEIQRTSDNSEGLFVFLFLSRNLRVKIPTEDFVENKKLETILLNHGIFISGENIKKFKAFANAFIIENQHIIKLTVLTSSTGWQEVNIPTKEDDGRVFVKRTLKYCNPILESNLGYVDAIQNKIYRSGEIDDAINILNNGLKWKGTTISILSGLAATLIYPLRKEGLGNFVVNFAGTTGRGKTLSARVGLSLFGNVSEGEDSLISNMDSTAVGNEIKFSTYKDMPILLDEAGTAKGSAEAKARKVLDTIFQFFSGQGRSRGQKKLKLRDEFEARGVLFLTMEFDLQTIEKIANTQEKGYFRRTIEVFSDSNEFLAPKEIFNFTIINKVFGHISSIFIKSIVDNFDKIKTDYEKYTKELENSSLRGKEKFFSSLFTVLDHLKRLELITEIAYQKAKSHLETVFYENLEIMEQVAEKAGEKWIEQLIEFVSMNETHFDDGERDISVIKFGEMKKNKSGEEEIRIYPNILDKFLIENGINSRSFFKAMFEKGILIKEEKRNKVKRDGVRMYVFRKKELFSYDKEENIELIIDNVKKNEKNENESNYIQFLGKIYDLDETEVKEQLKSALLGIKDLNERKKRGKELEELLIIRSGYVVVWENDIPIDIDDEIPF